MRVYITVCETLIAATPHGVYLMLNTVGAVSVTLTAASEQVLAIYGRYIVVLHPVVQPITNVFSRVKARTAR